MSFGILGIGFKLGSIAIFDEIFLFVFILSLLLLKRPLRVDLRLSLSKVISFLFLLYSIIALFSLHDNPNSYRYLFLSVAFFIYSLANENYSKSINVKHIVKFSYIYIGLTVFIPLYGVVNDLPVAFWQEYLWTGTAYSTFGVMIAALIIINNSHNSNSFSYVLFLCFVSAYLNDSRLTIVVIAYLFLYYSVRYKVANQIVLLFFIAIPLTLFSDIGLELLHSSYVGLIEVDNPEHNASYGRFLQLTGIFDYFLEYPYSLLLGNGSLTHQFNLSDFIGSDSSGKLRPIGVVAIIYDYGVLFYFLLLLQNLIYIFLLTKRLGIKFIFYGVPFFMLLHLFIFTTNLNDSVLFWLIFIDFNFVLFLFSHYEKHPNNKSIRFDA
jgi:hypothetical protein